MGEIEPVDDREIAGGDGGAGIAARALLDDAPAGVAVTRGPRHLVAYANACFRRLAGGAGGAGRPFAAAFPALAAGGVAARLDAVYAGEPDGGAVRPVRVAGAGAGETFLDIAVRPARDDAGRVDGCVVHATDATDRVLAVRAAGRIVRFQAVAAALAEAATPGEVAAAVVREGLAALGARGGGVVRLREDGGALEALHMVGYPPETIAAWRHYPLDIPSPGREAVETRAPVWVASPADLAARYPNLGRAAPAAGDRSWASLPLVVEGRVLGVLALGFAAEGAVPEADRAYALALARLCAQALERARLLAAERAARAAAEDARAWLDAVIRQLPVGVVVAEAPSGRLLLGNEQVARIWRQPSMSAEDERGYARYQGFHPDGRPYQPEEWPLARALAAGEVVAGERIAFARGDGTRGTLAVSAAPIRDDAGAIVAGVAAFHDVTAQVADEEALRASEEQYRALTEVSPQVVWVGRADGYIIHSNQYWFDYSGLTPAQASGAGWMAAIAPEHRERATAAWLRALREGGDYEIEIPLRRADGRYRWFLARGRPLRDAAGRIVRWVGVAIDIHERRQAEEERARLYDAERAARATAEEDRRRAALLAETSRIFATTAPEPRAILAAMARQVVAGIGDVCAISLLAADGRTLEPAVTDARDPQLRRFVADLLATWPVRLGEGLTGRVARSGEPVLLPRLDPPALRAVAMPEHRAPLARARPRSLLGVPLRVQGRVIGVLALARHTGDRPYTADDLALAQDLADRAALVLERARLAVTGRASRRRAEALAERLTLAQAAARIGTFAWDPESGAVAWTPELETLYGLPPGGFGGHLDAWARSVHPDDRARAVAAARAAVAAGGDLNTQFRIRRPDGAVRHLLARGRMTRGDDGRPRLVGVNMDVTEREEALAAAEAAVRARDEFLSIAAHELRTPVTGLKGAAQLLRQRHERGARDPEQFARLLAVLTASADRLAALVDDLLDVSRIRTGQLPLAREPLDLAALVRAAVDRARDQDAGAHYFAPETPASLAPVLADAGRFDQVLVNLLDNAMKYSPRGGTIAVAARDADGGVEVTVRDEGIGLPDGGAEAIFRPFGRAANAVRRQLPGLGLGLYICRDIVERHGGRIWAASAGEGHGATFTLWLPRNADARREGEADG